MSRHKSKRPPPEIGLFMECEDEDLNPAQKEFYGKIRKDHNAFTKKLDDYISKTKGEIIIEEGDCFLFQIKHSTVKEPSKNVVNNLKSIENKPVQPVSQMPVHVTRQAVQPKPNSRSRRSGRALVSPPVPLQPTPVVEQRGTRNSRASASIPTVAPPVTSPPSTRKATKQTTAAPEIARSEATAVGGLCVGKKISAKSALQLGGDTVEVLIGKTPGKTYPSLAVVARPALQHKPSLGSQSHTERANLDVQVKGVLMFTPTKFTEWLIQQGLIRSEQHSEDKDGISLMLKLGMYSEVSKFPYSGGYVWISESSSSALVSVFNNSIFEGSPHVPNVILKLMYHWSCQTNVANVLQWVNIEPLFLKNIYTLLRAVCVLSVHNKYGRLGGPSKKVQIGMFVIGPANPKDSDRSMKQEVLCVFDPKAKLLRFKAVEMDQLNKKRQHKKMLECLSHWVHKESIICSDSSIRRDCLQSLGFTHFYSTPQCNKDIIDYANKVLPKLFHNALPHLSRPLIQQFLDELVWRERWGPIAAHAFNNLVVHLSDLTRETNSKSLLQRLEETAVNPFALPPITYPDVISEDPDAAPKRGQKRGADQIAPIATPPPAKKSTLVARQEVANKDNIWKVCPLDGNISPEITAFLSETGKVSVDNYYFGFINGDDAKIVDRKPAEVISTKCCICLKSFFDNLALMKHLLLHCQIKPQVVGPLRKIHQCPKCFLGLPTATALRTHINNMHTPPEKLKQFVCLICEKIFADKVQFLYHMQRTHVANELPYSCEVCSYRSSSYDLIIEHVTHSHRSGQHIFCPYCMKAVGLFRQNVPLPGNVLFFVNHIQRHRRCEEAQCHRCRLSFVSLGLLQRHLEKDHSSFSSNSNLRHMTAVSGVMMPEPGNLIKPALLPRISKPALKPGVLSVKPFTSPIKYSVDSELTCAECEGFLDSPNHFHGEVKCNCCKFISNCELAVLEHFAMYHGSNDLVTFCPGQPVLLVSNMHCACGFFSSSPNTLAKHLITCGRITAYPNEAAAKSALQNENKKSTYQDEPNVLNMLGLIRKSPEPKATAELDAREASYRRFKSLQSKTKNNSEEDQIVKKFSKSSTLAKSSIQEKKTHEENNDVSESKGDTESNSRDLSFQSKLRNNSEKNQMQKKLSEPSTSQEIGTGEGNNEAITISEENKEYNKMDGEENDKKGTSLIDELGDIIDSTTSNVEPSDFI